MTIFRITFRILFFAAAISCCSSAPAPPASIKYAVIVDAGSSGSRIYVYQYDSTQSVPNLEQVKANGKSWKYKKEPGISTLAGKLGEVEGYIQDLISHLKTGLPESVFPRATWSQTPFMWFATAGMRLLKTKDADDLTNKIREVAGKKAVVPFKFENGWARTLSGEEEGAFAWISLNYRNGLFTNGDVEEHGVVEVGGASAQMTFMAKGNILSNKFVVIIDRKVYPLYTHSFLYFGQDQVIKRIFENECKCEPDGNFPSCSPCIVNNQYNSAKEVQSACLIKDYKRSHTITVEGRDGVRRDYEINLIGTGDPKQCAKEMEYLFRPDYDCFTKPCSFAGIYQPPFGNQKKFYGTSAIRHLTRDLGLLISTTREVTPRQITEAAKSFCKKHLDVLKNDKYAWMRCATGSYVAALLKNLQFNKYHYITVPEDDDWTEGAVLYTQQLMDLTLKPKTKIQCPRKYSTYDCNESVGRRYGCIHLKCWRSDGNSWCFSKGSGLDGYDWCNLGLAGHAGCKAAAERPCRP